MAVEINKLVNESSEPESGDYFVLDHDLGGGDFQTQKLDYDNLVPPDGSVTLAKMAANSVDSDQYVDGSIDAVHLASNAVETAKIKDDGVTNAKLADPYDVYSVLAAPDGMYLTVKDSYITFPVPDVHNAKSVVRLTAILATTSSSGNVTVRVYNVTDTATVGTITVTAGNTVGFTATIPAATLATNDILRIDVTGCGTGTKGLTVLVKVDKS